MYAKVMDLNYWASSECVHAEYNEEKSEWSVDVVRNGARTSLRPKQVVFALALTGRRTSFRCQVSRRFKGGIATRAATRPASPTPARRASS
jgi:hypothetical protein